MTSFSWWAAALIFGTPMGISTFIIFYGIYWLCKRASIMGCTGTQLLKTVCIFSIAITFIILSVLGLNANVSSYKISDVRAVTYIWAFIINIPIGCCISCYMYHQSSANSNISVAPNINNHNHNNYRFNAPSSRNNHRLNAPSYALTTQLQTNERLDGDEKYKFITITAEATDRNCENGEIIVEMFIKEFKNTKMDKRNKHRLVYNPLKSNDLIEMGLKYRHKVKSDLEKLHHAIIADFFESDLNITLDSITNFIASNRAHLLVFGFTRQVEENTQFQFDIIPLCIAELVYTFYGLNMDYFKKPKKLNKNMSIENGGSTVLKKLNGSRGYNNTIYGTKWIKTSQCVQIRWKLRVNNCLFHGQGIFIGICSKAIESNAAFFGFKYPWYSYDSSQCITSWKRRNSFKYGKKFGTNDIIVMDLNLRKKKLSFIVNGEKQGVAFDNVDNTVNYKLAVSINYPGDSVTILELTTIKA
eukprot:472427_1